MPRCPFCHCPNNWKICNKCGGHYCNSCGKGSNGVKRKSANSCPYCLKLNDGSKTTQKAPSYALT